MTTANLAHFNPSSFLDFTTSALKKGAAILVMEVDETTVSSIYSTQAGAAKANPFLTDATTGNADFWASSDRPVKIKVGGTFLTETATGAKLLFHGTVPGDSVPAKNVQRDYAVSMLNGGDQTGAINMACDDYHDAYGGGLVSVPPGTARCLGPVIYKKGITLAGSTKKASVLSWPNDLGSGAANSGLQPDLTTLGRDAIIRDLTLKGPGPSSTLGTASVDMSGVRLGPHTALKDCIVTNWGSGVRIMGDHQLCENVKSLQNYIGVEFEPASGDWATGSQTFGDQHFVGGEYTNNARAGFTCGLGNVMNDVLWDRTHIGFQPYAFWRDDGAHTTAFMIGCSLDQVTFEDIGNALFKDLSSAFRDSLSHSYWRFSFIGGFAGAYKIAAETSDNLFYMTGAMYGADLSVGYPNFLPSGITQYFTVADVDTSTVLRNFPVPAAAGAFWYGAGVPGALVVNGSFRGTMQVAAGTITQGDLVALVGGAVTRLTAGNMASYFGAAVTDATVGTYLPVSLPGSVFYVRSEAVAQGALLRPLAGTEHHATSAGGNPVIGQAALAGGAGGGALVRAYIR